MRPTAEISRSVWWAFGVGGGLALVAAAITALGLVAATPAAGAWLFGTGALILLAIRRAPVGIADAIPFLGAGAGGVVLGAVGVALPADDQKIALIAIGVWALVAGAGYLAVARMARAYRVPDGGLTTVAWASIIAGMGISVLTVFGLGAAAATPAVAMAVVSVVTIVASSRLRTLPDEAPPALSHREQRRRERTLGEK